MSLGRTYHALSDPNRLKILEILKKKDEAVQDILKHLTITGASLSHHLAVLKSADLVSSRRDGQQIIYTLNLSVFEMLMKELTKFLKK